MILDVTQRKCDCFRRYSSDIQCFQILLNQNTVILDVISKKSDFRRYSTQKNDFRRYSTKMRLF